MSAAAADVCGIHRPQCCVPQGTHRDEECLLCCAVPAVLQVGVKQGGCSGMSYVMDFEQPDNIKDADYVIEYESGAFKLACDPKSLL